MSLRLARTLLILFLILFNPIPNLLHSQDFGYVKIETDSAGIEILIDGKLIGMTPLPFIALQPGIHQIAALHPQRFLWGNLDWLQTVQIAAGDSIILKPSFKILFSLQSKPFGAEIYINGEFQGTTPLTIAIESKDSSSVILKKEGYNDQFLNLNQFQTNHLQIPLVRNNQLFDFKQVEENEQKKQSHYRKLTYGMWGLSVLTGLATVYFKDQADEKYRQYLVASSLRDMNKLFNDSRRFDQYSNISLGAVQGCFVLSFYFLIKSVK
ncbi:MAG: PEGA domain-containing protein [bacterium]|nr:PEGA domain-containing protein [bacterium]